MNSCNMLCGQSVIVIRFHPDMHKIGFDSLKEACVVDAFSTLHYSDFQKFEKKYKAEVSKGSVSKDTQFEYAWCLIRSKHPEDIKKGIVLLDGNLILKRSSFPHFKHLATLLTAIRGPTQANLFGERK